MDKSYDPGFELREAQSEISQHRRDLDRIREILDRYDGMRPGFRTGRLRWGRSSGDSEHRRMTVDTEKAHFTGRGIQKISGLFEVVEGHTDRHAIHEVWDRNDYRLRKDHVSGQIVIDIGANLGAFSVLAAKLGAKLVVAYEPQPETFEALCSNVISNGVRDVVETWPVAVVGHANGKIRVTGDGGGARAQAQSAGREVQAHSIEAVLGDFGRIGFVKIDCEGGEVDIFRGLDVELLDRVDHLAMEFHGPKMPHLTDLDPNLLGPIVVKLAECGWLQTHGRPSTGGMLFFTNYRLGSPGFR